MKRLTLLALLALISASALFATPITGSVVFWGETDSPNEHDWSNVSGFQCSTYNIWLTGDLASFTIWRPNTERFSLTSAGFSEGSGDYMASFVSTSFSDSVRTVDSFEAHGEGIMNMSGFDATYGTWSVLVLGYYVPDHSYMNEGHSIVSFVASGNAVTESAHANFAAALSTVPEASSTLGLLLIAVAGMIVVRRSRLTVTSYLIH